MRPFGAVLAIVMAMLGWECSGSSHEIPPTPTWATDRAGFISEGARLRTQAKLREFSKRTGHEVILYIDRDLPRDVDIAAYSMLLFNSWGIGRLGKDDGVALFIYVESRQVWITVGYGLERKLPDHECMRIVTEIMRPKLQANDPDGAVEDAIDAILTALQSH